MQCFVCIWFEHVWISIMKKKPKKKNDFTWYSNATHRWRKSKMHYWLVLWTSQPASQLVQSHVEQKRRKYFQLRLYSDSDKHTLKYSNIINNTPDGYYANAIAVCLHNHLLPADERRLFALKWNRNNREKRRRRSGKIYRAGASATMNWERSAWKKRRRKNRRADGRTAVRWKLMWIFHEPNLHENI